MNTNDEFGKLKKIKTKSSKSHNKTKYKKHNRTSSIDNNNNSKRKVKFVNEIEIIDVESWKAYNLEQTAEENIEAFFYEESEQGIITNNKKLKERKGNVSCTCIII